jgi:hypothetical protein
MWNGWECRRRVGWCKLGCCLFVFIYLIPIGKRSLLQRLLPFWQTASPPRGCLLSCEDFAGESLSGLQFFFFKATISRDIFVLIILTEMNLLPPYCMISAFQWCGIPTCFIKRPVRCKCFHCVPTFLNLYTILLPPIPPHSKGVCIQVPSSSCRICVRVICLAHRR